MQQIRVAAAVLNQTPLAWASNKQNIEKAIAEARRQGATVLCLPELCISGYGCEDAFASFGVQKTCWEILNELVPLTQGMIVSFGLPVNYNSALFNTSCLVADGKILGFVGKRFLAGDGIHYEPRWFKPWPEGKHATVNFGERSFPIGDLYFECGGVRIGFEICEDAWVAQRPGAMLARKGVDIILNPSASHFAFGKSEIRRRFVQEGSRAFGVSYVLANLMGNEAGRTIFDGGAVIASSGRILATGPRLRYADVLVTSAVIDVEQTRMERSRISGFLPIVENQAPDRIVTQFSFPTEIADCVTQRADDWERSPHLKEEEFSRAVALALFDYMRKSRSHGFVVSLSGGADSSAICTLIRLMVEFATRELGTAGALEKLKYFRRIQAATTPTEIMHGLLSCVYQSTENSSETTRNAAETLAQAVGAEYLEFNVDALVKGYTSMVSGALGRELTWDQDDLALQNIQARVRAPGVWMLANIRGALLLATSNRSEAAVGYATMDGDTSGGLSPIAGIDKAFVRHWLRWMETDGPAEMSAFGALRVVNVQQPTAELRPASYKQTDEDDLMPYEVLDAIERCAIRDKKMPAEIFGIMLNQFPQIDSSLLAMWVERFFRLWCRNQWKRERYAPSFHLDDESLDPKSWCRFPILSGGFDREIEDLHKLAASRRRKE